MTAITYDEGGLHLITGRCIAVDDQFHRAEADDVFGYAEICHIASDAELVEELLKRQYGFTNILAPRTPKHTFQDGFCPFLRGGEFFAKATETAARNGSSSGGFCALRMCRLPERTSIIAPKTAFRERSCGLSLSNI